jgi:thiol-disulfide isomerase/thioredoxin
LPLKQFHSTYPSQKILFSNWCPTCIPTDKEFQASTDKIPADVAVIRVNYQDTDTDQEEKDLAKKYGVTYQHTFVEIDAQGNKVTSWNGGGVDELIAKLQ